MYAVKRQLELKASLVRADMSYRRLAIAMQERGHRFHENDVSRIVSGRWFPPENVRQSIASILGKKTFELFH
jgi:hypothetical protein